MPQANRTGKTLDSSSERNVRAALERIAEDLRDPKRGDDRGVDVRLAELLGFSQGHFHHVRKKGGPIGLDLTREVARQLHVTEFVVLTYGPPPRALTLVLRKRPKRWSTAAVVSTIDAMLAAGDPDGLLDWQWEELLDTAQKHHIDLQKRRKQMRRG